MHAYAGLKRLSLLALPKFKPATSHAAPTAAATVIDAKASSSSASADGYEPHGLVLCDDIPCA
jgi:hypothetical protein